MPKIISIRKQLPGHYMKKRGDRSYTIYSHTIWTKEEADKLGLAYVKYNELLKEENHAVRYVLTDDDIVGLVYRMAYIIESRNRNRKRALLKSSAGSVMLPARQFSNTFCRTNSDYIQNFTPWYKKKLYGGRGELFIRSYLTMLMTSKMDYARLGQLLYPKDDPHYWPVKARYYLNNKESKDYVMNRLQKLMNENGVTEKYVIDLFKKTVEVAEQEGQAEVIRKTAKDLVQLLRMDQAESNIGEIPAGGSGTLDEEGVRLLQEAEEMFNNMKKEETDATAEKSIEGGLEGIGPGTQKNVLSIP